MMSRVRLLDSLEQYVSCFREELDFKHQFLKLLAHPRAFFRDHLPGHITASSWIVDESRKFTLLTHHKKLDRWLQPGGHADGEEDVWAVAQHEAFEETGLTSLQLLLPDIFDIDIHVIPSRSEFPEHQHYDIRFLFKASMHEPLALSEESEDLKWIVNEDISRQTGANLSILRMAEKVRNLP
jgi:8-oxo-dGTP pyrophosphatase MutT (NUDIX family)